MSLSENVRQESIDKILAERKKWYRIGVLPDDEYAQQYPEAYELVQYFDSFWKKSRCPIRPQGAQRKSRRVAVKISQARDIDISLFKDCIAWCFSEERLQTHWGKYNFHHLGTVLRVYRSDTRVILYPEAKMTDAEFASSHPEAASLIQEFLELCGEHKETNLSENMAKSRLAAMGLVRTDKPNLSEFREFMAWCFSNERLEIKFWGRYRIANLATIAKWFPTIVYKGWAIPSSCKYAKTHKRDSTGC